MANFTKDNVIEQSAIQLMQHELGLNVVDSFDEWNCGVNNQGRGGKREVVLISPLRPALHKLNQDVTVEVIEGAIEVTKEINY